MDDLMILDSEGNTCDGCCNACDSRDECEYYDGYCKGDCNECSWWSGGCEA